MAEEGTRSEEMEDICRGLYPVVNGQNLQVTKSESAAEASVLTLGGTNPGLYTGNFTHIYVTVPRFWEFKMDRVELADGRGTFCKRRCNIIVDSETTLILGPMKANELNRMLGGKLMLGVLGVCHFPCSLVPGLPDVNCIINGTKLRLTSRQYTLQIGDVCLSAFRGAMNSRKMPSSWILGSMFMRTYYTMFDRGNFRIGLARAKHLEDDYYRNPHA
ncbi:cathepsin d [Plakobranchus ocellatus]|uniref:Cathepsin d n=1 Tax=Plakobranchus ocellatus TaxID=259542 RepID=A0AAV3YVW9_9GAST|nr:cathepsin d [Plakobranchus ocellatus]